METTLNPKPQTAQFDCPGACDKYRVARGHHAASAEDMLQKEQEPPMYRVGPCPQGPEDTLIPAASLNVSNDNRLVAKSLFWRGSLETGGHPYTRSRSAVEHATDKNGV